MKGAEYIFFIRASRTVISLQLQAICSRKSALAHLKLRMLGFFMSAA